MRATLFAFALALSILGPSPVRADAVGAFDPELARICGGTAHDPRCSPERMGICCCASFGLAAIGAVVFFTMGRRESPR